MALFEDAPKLRVTIMLSREQRDELQELANRAGVSRSQVARVALVEGIAAVRRRMDVEDQGVEDVEAGVSPMYDQRTGKLTPDGFAKVKEWLGAKQVAQCCEEAPGCGVYVHEYMVVTGVLDMPFVKSLRTHPPVPSLGRALIHVSCDHCAAVKLYDANDIFGQTVF